jgi:Zn-dependent protease
VPIPPLDGSQILFSFLPEKYGDIKNFLYQYGQFLLLLFIFFGFGLLNAIVFWAYRLLLG